MPRTQIDNRLIKDRNITGASINPELGFYDETMNYLSGDSVIWRNQKYICNVNIIGAEEGNLSNNPELSSDWDLQPNVSYSVFPSTSTNVDVTPTVVNFDTERESSPYCSLAGSEITILSSGTFLVSASFASDSTDTSTRNSSYAFLQIDTGGGFVNIPNFELVVYNRVLENGKGSASLLIPINFNAGDKIRMQAGSNLSNNIVTYPPGCNITIFGLDAIAGPRGAQGEAGPSGDLKWLGGYTPGTYNQYDTVQHNGTSYTCLVNGTTSAPPGTLGFDWDIVALKGTDGAGSTLTILDNNSAVVNTPHGALNFADGIIATDAGSGVADINIEFPKNTYMVAIYAEEGSNLSNTTYEWSFGNGANTPAGFGVTIYVPSDYKCELVAMSLSIRQGTATVEALKNSTPLGAAANVTVNSGTRNTNEFTGIEYSNNDVINFRTTSAVGTGGPNVVTAWLRYTEI